MQLDVDRGVSRRWCGARTRGGKNCRHEAGWGTDHPGWGRCKMHGGNTRNGRLFAARLEALAEMPAFGADVDIEAIDALLFCIRREAGREAWLRLRLQLLDPEGVEAIADPAGLCAELHRLEAQSTERLARFSKMALDAGVAERRIRLVERQARALAHAFTTALDAHPMAARLSNAERAELVSLFAAQLALLEAAPQDVTGQAREVG